MPNVWHRKVLKKNASFLLLLYMLSWAASLEASHLIRVFMTCEQKTISIHTAENHEFSATQREGIKQMGTIPESLFLAPNNNISY